MGRNAKRRDGGEGGGGSIKRKRRVIMDFGILDCNVQSTTPSPLEEGAQTSEPYYTRINILGRCMLLAAVHICPYARRLHIKHE